MIWNDILFITIIISVLLGLIFHKKGQKLDIGLPMLLAIVIGGPPVFVVWIVYKKWRTLHDAN